MFGLKGLDYRRGPLVNERILVVVRRIVKMKISVKVKGKMLIWDTRRSIFVWEVNRLENSLCGLVEFRIIRYIVGIRMVIGVSGV